jgi:peptidoglycan/xylan/chitin deacetylase (PgdA/CDA1 family)
MRLRPSLIRWAAAGLYGAGLTRPLSVVLAYAGRASFPVFTYHRVNDDDDPFFPATPIRVFEQRMAYLARTCTVFTVEALVRRMRRGSVPRNAVAVTFDDGYRDNLTNAAPILSRYALPATIFLATDAIGTGRALWFDRLALAFRDTSLEVVLAPWREPLETSTRTQRLAALDRSLGVLKGMEDQQRRRAVDELLNRLGLVDESPLRRVMLSWDEVHALRGIGFSIGAHTVDHPILSRTQDAAARAQIVESRHAIERMCGEAPQAFAYPNGSADDYNSDVVRLVREAGFTCALTTRFGVNMATTSPWELRRGGPWETEMPTFALKLAQMRLVPRSA